MTLTFLTNFINHHQVSLADEYYKILGDDYTFVAYEPLPDSFRRSGYPEYNKPYLLKAYESEDNMKKVLKLIQDSDVVVFGQFPYSLVRKRILANKLTFCDDERWFKEYFKDCWKNFKFWFRPLYKFYQHTLYRNKNYYLLCASAYVAYDASLVRAFPNKCFKWGYFTQVPDLNMNSILEKKRNTSEVKILWVGRFIGWKHPELIVELAMFLKNRGYKFHIDMYGVGYLREQIVKKVNMMELSQEVSVNGSLPNEEILKQMQSHHVFCFTSDKNEGWGAVLNEAMSNGCCPVASNMVGAAPYLIKDGYNGLLYNNDDKTTIYEKVEILLRNPQLREEMTVRAYETMKNTWCAQTASKKFIQLATSLLLKKEEYNEFGPCSIAPIIKSFLI